MKFQMTPELIDEVIFGMENQESTYFIDTEECVVVPEDDENFDLDADPDRYLEVPDWTSIDGFKLMERFAAGLRNPIVRENLRLSLGAGRGVFRNFKNALKERPDVEKLWFSYKEREMRKLVVEWYNELCEVWGFQKLAVEEEETEELVLSDFVLSHPVSEEAMRARLLDMDRCSYREALDGYPPGWVDAKYEKDRTGVEFRDGQVILAETPSGETAGFIWGQSLPADSSEGISVIDRILQLFVVPEYRGLGVSKALLERYCREAYDRNVSRIFIDCVGGSLGFGERIESEGFEVMARTYVLDVGKWGRGNSEG